MSNISEVEKGIPIPVCARGCPAGKRKYPFASMEIGDSFTVTVNGYGETARQLLTRVSPAMNHYGKRLKAKFTSRTIENGVRIWRVE